MRMLYILCSQSQPWQTDLHLTKVSFAYVLFQEKYYQSYSSWCWKVPLEIIQSNHPAQSRINQSRLPRTVPGRALSTFQDGDSTTCPGSLCQCSSTLMVRKRELLFMLTLNFLHFTWSPLSCHCHCEVFGPILFIPSYQLGTEVDEIHPEPSLPRAEQPQLCQPHPLYVRYS